MVVCKYFRQGDCKFGARCKFEHPRDLKTGQSSTFASTVGTSTSNLFSAGNSRTDQARSADVTAEGIKTDLTIDRPPWPFTSYCPVKYGTSSLITGHDLSYEEVRALAYEAVANQALPAFEQNMNSKADQVNREVQAILGNLSQAVKVAQESNRITSTGAQGASAFGQASITAGTGHTQGNPFSLSNNKAFGSANQGTTNPFGQSAQNALGLGHSLSGTASFGNTNAASTLGQTSPFVQDNSKKQSVFGQSPSSVFGMASQPSSAFLPSSTPATLPSNSVFGNTSTGSVPSAFGQPSQPQSVFGQTMTQPSAFPFQKSSTSSVNPLQSSQTNTPATTNPFAGTPTPSIGAFGQSNATANPFGSSTFGQPAQIQSAFQQASPSQNSFSALPSSSPGAVFGATSGSQIGQNQSGTVQTAFGQASGSSAPSSAFSQPTTSAFGTPSKSAAGPFGSSAFGKPPASSNTNVFGATSTPATTSAFGSTNSPGNANSFGSASAFGAQSASPSAFGNTTLTANSGGFGNTSAFGSTNNQIPGTSSTFAIQKPLDNTPTSAFSSPASAFGQPKSSQPAMLANEFQDATADTLGSEDKNSPLPEELLEQFRAPQFTIGKIPEVPPPRTLVTT